MVSFIDSTRPRFNLGRMDGKLITRFLSVCSSMYSTDFCLDLFSCTLFFSGIFSLAFFDAKAFLSGTNRFKLVALGVSRCVCAHDY